MTSETEPTDKATTESHDAGRQTAFVKIMERAIERAVIEGQTSQFVSAFLLRDGVTVRSARVIVVPEEWDGSWAADIPGYDPDGD